MLRFAKRILSILILILLFWALNASFRNQVFDKPERINYDRLLTRVRHDQVRQVTVGKNQVKGVYMDGGRFIANIPEGDAFRQQLAKALDEHRVQTDAETSLISEPWMNLMFSVFLPLLVIVGMWMFFFKQAQAGGSQALSFGRSRAKRVTDNIPKVTFDDVAGVDEAKAELAEVVEFLRNPKKFQALGAKIPRGVLLLGPPGCGKTLLARAIAGEAGVPFFHISGSDFVEMFVGVGASRVRDLFETAKANRPSLVFIDEIDAVGRQRGAGLGGGHDEREQTLNQLLVEMDGFDPNSGVILIAATNRPDVLDPALLRPGRFDRHIVVDHPDVNGRLAILKVHTKDKPLAPDVDLETLARRTPGFSGADLANLVNEAALLAARRELTAIGMKEFDAAIDRVIAGPERKSRIISDHEREVVAYHEVGHAIVGELLPNGDPVHKISILPTKMALGYTMRLPKDDKYLVSRSKLLDDIAARLAGRVAEEMVFQEVWTGAHEDLEEATELARRMVCEFGMSDRLGPLALGRRHSNPFLGRDIMEDRNYSEEVAKAIDEEVKAIVNKAYSRAKEILTENRETMDRIVKVLLRKETLDRKEFELLLRGEELPAAPQAEQPPTSQPPGGETQRRSPEVVPKLRPEPA
ncbi:MAG: ATP-dependent zinc metalloprotease FtsH [Armatimonadota bacterium]